MTDHAKYRAELQLQMEHKIVNKALSLAHRWGFQTFGVYRTSTMQFVPCASRMRVKTELGDRPYGSRICWIDGAPSQERHWIDFPLTIDGSITLYSENPRFKVILHELGAYVKTIRG